MLSRLPHRHRSFVSVALGRAIVATVSAALTEIFIPNARWYHTAIESRQSAATRPWGASAPGPPAAETAPGLRITKILRCVLTVPSRMLGADGTKVVGIHAMNTQANGLPPAAPAWLYLQRAREAVNRAAAELPRTQLGPQARQQYALELAELMGKVELLLSTLRRQASDDPHVRPTSAQLRALAWGWPKPAPLP